MENEHTEVRPSRSIMQCLENKRTVVIVAGVVFLVSIFCIVGVLLYVFVWSDRQGVYTEKSVVGGLTPEEALLLPPIEQRAWLQEQFDQLNKEIPGDFYGKFIERSENSITVSYSAPVKDSFITNPQTGEKYPTRFLEIDVRARVSNMERVPSDIGQGDLVYVVLKPLDADGAASPTVELVSIVKPDVKSDVKFDGSARSQ